MKDYIREGALYIEWKVTIYINVSNRMVKTVLFYGAGEVAEMLLTAIKNENTDISVCAIIDDDVNKIGKKNYSTKEIKSGLGINYITTLQERKNLWKDFSKKLTLKSQ